MAYKSKESSFNGIWLWVQSNRHDLIKDRPPNKEMSNLRKIIKEFLIEKNIPHKKQVSSNFNNKQVQKNFREFKEWILNK
jgi:hypothetical protein